MYDFCNPFQYKNSLTPTDIFKTFVMTLMIIITLILSSSSSKTNLFKRMETSKHYSTLTFKIRLLL